MMLLGLDFVFTSANVLVISPILYVLLFELMIPLILEWSPSRHIFALIFDKVFESIRVVQEAGIYTTVCRW